MPVIKTLKNGVWTKVSSFGELATATSSLNGLMSSADKVKLDKMSNYSTDEQVIGTWIDGKPIYRKVAVVSAITGNNVWNNVDNAPTDVRTYINAYGYLFNQQTGICTYKVPFSQHNNLQYSVCLHSNQYLAGTGVEGLSMFIVYEYTKTTD